MELSSKRINWYMCRIRNITYLHPPNKYICNKVNMCVGEVLLNSGNKETLHLVKPEKDL